MFSGMAALCRRSTLQRSLVELLRPCLTRLWYNEDRLPKSTSACRYSSRVSDENKDKFSCDPGVVSPSALLARYNGVKLADVLVGHPPHQPACIYEDEVCSRYASGLYLL